MEEDDADGDPLWSVDTEWIKDLETMPRGKVLFEHLAALGTITQSGGVKPVEPPIEQCATWLRAFCYAYSKTDTPFDIVSHLGEKRLPKSVAICNLSGRYGIFYSEKYSLVKVLCLVAQDASTRLIQGVMKVIEKAEKTGSSVIVCFCLPFQSGLERVHWTIRTIRKTVNGAVKDGELFFSPFDDEPREVPCTSAIEHWSQSTLSEVGRMLASKANPVCLDKMEDDSGVRMTFEQMSGIVEMLKADRRRTIELYKSEKAEIDAKHKKQLIDAETKVKDAVHGADVRVSKVASVSKVAEDTLSKKIKVLEHDTTRLRQELAAQQTLCKERHALLNGQKLEHDHEIKQYVARQKTLEAQVATINSSHAKQVAENAKHRREAQLNRDKETSQLKSKIVALESKLQATESASMAVQACSKENRNKMLECNKNVSICEADLKRSRQTVRVFRGVLVLAAHRMQAVTQASDATKLEEHQIVAQKLTNAQQELEDIKKQAKDSHQYLLRELAEKQMCINTIAEMEEQLDKVNITLESTKRNLENALAESLKKQLSETESNLKRVVQQTDSNRPRPPHHNNNNSYPSTNTVNVSQSTAVYVAHQPQHAASQHSHYNPGYSMDPALENAISHIHSSLNCITSLARSSTSNARQVNILQAKLDALAGVGMQTHGYYDLHPQAYPLQHR
jgi:hypothetical protein